MTGRTVTALRAQAAEDLAWRLDGACAQVDPELFFPNSPAPATTIAVCEGCPVQAQCLTYAVDNGEEFGIWGGLSPAARRRLQLRTA